MKKINLIIYGATGSIGKSVLSIVRSNRTKFNVQGITCNKNAIPFDEKSPFITSGIRVGTAAGTTRGFKEEHFSYIGELIVEVINRLNSDDKVLIEKTEIEVRRKVKLLCSKFPIY